MNIATHCPPGKLWGLIVSDEDAGKGRRVSPEERVIFDQDSLARGIIPVEIERGLRVSFEIERVAGKRRATEVKPLPFLTGLITTIRVNAIGMNYGFVRSDETGDYLYFDGRDTRNMAQIRIGHRVEYQPSIDPFNWKSRARTVKRR
ncbi:hypothetical protein [Bradyrhizobium genosp. P]|uniref:hypothetical protein n=1 Tax=Bradyrhizobium genosp. P TaxID=83641 RepID=UPI003CE9054C